MVTLRHFFATAVSAATVPAALIPAFRRFFAFHTFLHSLKLGWAFEGSPLVPITQAVLFLAALGACHRRFYRLGLVLLLLYKLWWIQLRFPITGNHPYAEAWILLCLLLLPDRPLDNGQAASGSCRLIQLSALSIYFYSGVQKLVYGLWLNGEYLALSLFSDSVAGLWHSTKLMVMGLARIFGSEVGPLPLDRPVGLTTVELGLPVWTVVFFLVLGWVAVLSEVGAPPLVLWRRTRRFGLPLILATVIGIGFISLETEFMFATVGCLFLFFTSRPDRNFNWLLAIHAVWSLAVIAIDFQMWIL